ncbi:hypothetical protein ACP70R_025678 [Stipagrostis hirtigluma subsp. patula]
MVAAAEKEDAELVDYDQDDEDAMEEDGRAARALPVAHIGQPRPLRLPLRRRRPRTRPAAL